MMETSGTIPSLGTSIEPEISPLVEQQIAGWLELTRTMATAKDLYAALYGALQPIAEIAGWCYGEVWIPDAQQQTLHSVATWYEDDPALAEFASTSTMLTFTPGVGLAGRVWESQMSEWIPDLAAVASLALLPERAVKAQLRSALFLPIMVEERVVALLVFFGRKVRPKNEPLFRLITLVAAQIGAAIYRLQMQEAVSTLNAELEQRVAERTAALSAANAELERTARLKDEFLANMSHELRTPLHTILTLTEAVTEGIYGELNARQNYALSTVNESGQHLLALINDILDLTKIESGRVSLSIEPVSVEELCAASLRIVRQSAHLKHLHVSSMLDSQVETVLADARRLKQILVNLLSNAVKFTPEGGCMSLEVYADPDAEVVHFQVHDTGIGIATEHILQLFKPFVQLDSRLNRRHEGTGLGLALVAHLTELHNGGISVTSSLGQGSCFTVTLPWKPLLLGEEDAAPLATHQVVILPDRGQPMILLAEDNETMIKTAQDYLLACGYAVRIARNGVEAVHLAKELLPEVILMDIHMPVMDGFAAIQQIRADSMTAAIPIIALTALAMAGDRERCLQAGANDYLSKPVQLTRLIEHIEGLRHS